MLLPCTRKVNFYEGIPFRPSHRNGWIVLIDFTNTVGKRRHSHSRGMSLPLVTCQEMCQVGVIVGFVVCPSCQQALGGRLRGNISRYFMASVARMIEKQQEISKGKEELVCHSKYS